MTRAALACFRLELFRDRRVLAYSMATAIVLAICAATIPWTGEDPIAVVIMVLSGAAGFFLAFRPIGQLMGDRMSGRLAVERALPIPWSTIAAARLAAASVRLIVVPAFTSVILIAISRENAIPAGVVIAVMLAAWLVAVIGCWSIMAANARWSMIRLWWVPTTIWLAPQFLPDTWRRAIWLALKPIGPWAVTTWTSPTGPAVLAMTAFAALIIVAAASTALYASGLRRFVHDADPLSIRGKRDRVMRLLEYPGGRKSVVASVALLDIRLGFERLQKQGVLLLALIAVALFGPQSLRDLAPTYIRIIGWMVPGVVLFGIVTARHSGALATLQQLPSPRWHIAAGKAAAVIVLSVIGALVVDIARVVDPELPPYSQLELLNATLQLALGVWIGTALSAWWQRRYIVPVTLGGAAIGALLAASPGTRADILNLLRSGVLDTGLLFGCVVLTLAIGIPLCAHGVARYQKA